MLFFRGIYDVDRACSKEESEPWYVLNEDASIINLGHILPKKPLENWPTFSVEEHNFHVNKLGYFCSDASKRKLL